MATAMEIRPIDRDRLLDALNDAMLRLIDAGISEGMTVICKGGLQFLITGEDGERLSDSDLQCMARNEDALVAMLFCDLRSACQGFDSTDDRQDAWKICDTIAAAFCKCLQEQ